MNENSKSLTNSGNEGCVRGSFSDEDALRMVPDPEPLPEDKTEQTVVTLTLSRIVGSELQVIKRSVLFVAETPEENPKAWAAYDGYHEIILQFNKIIADYLESAGVKFDAQRENQT